MAVWVGKECCKDLFHGSHNFSTCLPLELMHRICSSLRASLINLKRHIFSFKDLGIVAGNINLSHKLTNINLIETCFAFRQGSQFRPKESYWTSFYSNCDNMCYIGDMEDIFCHFTCLSVRLQKNPKIMEDTQTQMENFWNSAKNIQNNVWTTVF